MKYHLNYPKKYALVYYFIIIIHLLKKLITNKFLANLFDFFFSTFFGVESIFESFEAMLHIFFKFVEGKALFLNSFWK